MIDHTIEFPFLHEVADTLTSDVYFSHSLDVLDAHNLDPYVDIRIFCRSRSGILCGVREMVSFLRQIGFEGLVRSDPDGTALTLKPTIEVECNYSQFCLYETAILGILASSTGWASAAREISRAANGKRVYSFGARHAHPNVAGSLDYSAIVGGCDGCSTTLGALLANRPSASGTMPHALVLLIGDTVKAMSLFHEVVDSSVPRVALVDTFKDEIEESLNVANAAPYLQGIRLDTCSERGGVTPDLVKELRWNLDNNGFSDVSIIVSGGFDVEKITSFEKECIPVDAYGVGSFIAHAAPIDWTADIVAVNGTRMTKRGRIPIFTRSAPVVYNVEVDG